MIAAPASDDQMALTLISAPEILAAPVWLSPLLFALALLLVLRWRVEALWVVPMCGALGYFLL